MPRNISRHRRADGSLPPLAGADPAGTADLTEKLKRVEEQIASARDERKGAAEKRDAAKAAFAGTEDLSAESAEFKAAEDAVREVGSIDDRIAGLNDAHVGILKMLGQRDPDRTPVGDPRDPRAGRKGWDSEGLFTEDQREFLSKMAHTKTRFGQIDLGEVEGRDAFKTDIVGSANQRRDSYFGVVPQLRRVLRIVDLLPVGTMTQNVLPYTQESGALTGAAETAEGAVKPEAATVFTDQNATAVTIAAWNKVQRQTLDDVPAMQSIIDGRLQYMVQRRLEAEVLAGNGTSPNMTGILNTSGILTQTFATGATVVEQVLKGMTQVMLADANPTAVVLNPSDWQAALIGKTSGSGEYIGGGPFEVTAQTIWGLPVIPSASIAAGTALVGDFQIGAELFIRDGVHTLVSDSDQDDFVRNRITILAEMRAALAVFRPAAFCSVALA